MTDAERIAELEAKLAEAKRRAVDGCADHASWHERWMAAEARIEVLEKAARRVLERCPVCDDGREDAECICTELVSARMVELEAALARRG